MLAGNFVLTALQHAKAGKHDWFYFLRTIEPNSPFTTIP